MQGIAESPTDLWDTQTVPESGFNVNDRFLMLEPDIKLSRVFHKDI